MLLVLPGCSFPSAASVVGEFVSVLKPIVGLVEVVGRSLRDVLHVVWELGVCLVLRPALLEWPRHC